MKFLALLLTLVNFQLMAGSFTDLELKQFFQKSLHIKSDEALKVVKTIGEKLGRDSENRIRINGVLESAWRANVTYFYNFTQRTDFHLFARHPQTDRVVKIHNALQANLSNHGITTELISGKKFYLFIPENYDLSDFEGAHMNGVATGLPGALLLSMTGIASIELGGISGVTGNNESISATYLSISLGLLPANLVSFPSLTTQVNWDKVNRTFNR